MLVTDEKWTNEYLKESLPGNSEIKIEDVKFSTYTPAENFGVDLGNRQK